MGSNVTRQEHLEWCKKRAIEYIDAGNVSEALSSFASDVTKHPETEAIRDTIANLGIPLLMAGAINTPQAMRKHINGYN